MKEKELLETLTEDLDKQHKLISGLTKGTSLIPSTYKEGSVFIQIKYGGLTTEAYFREVKE